MTYRTGNHWGVTIVREGQPGYLFGLDVGPEGKHGPACRWPVETCVGHPAGPLADDQLVAVVVNGDTALAERICALLNIDQQPGGLLTQWVRDMSDTDFETLKAQFLADVGQSRRLTVLPPTPDVCHTRGAAEALALVRRLTHARFRDEDLAPVAPSMRKLLDLAAAELGVDEKRAPGPFGPTADPCTGCGDARADHRDGQCVGDFGHCPCQTWMPIEPSDGRTDA